MKNANHQFLDRSPVIESSNDHSENTHLREEKRLDSNLSKEAFL